MRVQSTTAAPADAQCRSLEQVLGITAAPVATQHRNTNEVWSLVAALECAREQRLYRIAAIALSPTIAPASPATAQTLLQFAVVMLLAA